MDEYIKVGRCNADLAQDDRLRVLHAEGRENHGILQRKILLCIEVNRFETGGQRFCGLSQLLIPPGVKGEVLLDEAGLEELRIAEEKYREVV